MFGMSESEKKERYILFKVTKLPLSKDEILH